MGRLWAIGSNHFGVLGQGDTSELTSVTQVGAEADWQKLAAGRYHALAIRADGSLWACGHNLFGQLGLGDTTDRHVFTRVGTASDWVAVFCGINHSLAIRADGSLWSWGYNNRGQLGVGDTDPRLSPALVSDAAWLTVTAGDLFSLAINTLGELYGWGLDQTTPVHIGAEHWAAVSATWESGLLIKVNGDLYGFTPGYPWESITPALISTDTWISCAANEHSYAAVRDDATLWTWGDQGYCGELGHGNYDIYESPTMVGLGADWELVLDNLSYTTLALKTDLSLWGAGCLSHLDPGGDTTVMVRLAGGAGGPPLAGEALYPLAAGHGMDFLLLLDATRPPHEWPLALSVLPAWPLALSVLPAWPLALSVLPAWPTTLRVVEYGLSEWGLALAVIETDGALFEWPLALDVLLSADHLWAWPARLRVVEELAAEWPLALDVLLSADHLWAWPLALDVLLSADHLWAWPLALTVVDGARGEWPLALEVYQPDQPEWALALDVLLSADHLWAWPLTLETVELVDREWGLALAVVEDLRAEWALDLAVVATWGHFWLWPLALAVGENPDFQFPLALTVGWPTVQPSWPLALAVSGAAQGLWPLALAVVDRAALLASPAHAWTPIVRLAGADLSGRLLGAVELVAEENAAVTATLALLPASGAIQPSAYLGAELTVTYRWSAGGLVQDFPLFTGRVDAVAVDAASFALRLTCSDRRAVLLAANAAALLAGSRWSAGVFDPASAGRMAEDRLTTLCADFHLAPDGSPVLADWAAKSTPDWLVDADVYLADSLALTLASSADLVHGVSAALAYRFPRLRLREARVDYGGDLPALLRAGIAPPSSALIQAALDDTGWIALAEPNYIRPGRDWYAIDGVWCGVDAINSVVAMSARLGRRFAQTIEERIALDVVCSDSPIDRRQTLSGALEANFDAQAWEDDAGRAPVLAAPGWDIETVADATDDADTGRAAADNAVATLLAQARRVILASHRGNRVTFGTPLNPLVTRAWTVRLEAAGVTAQGKVYRLVHRLDPDAGEATTTVDLAISLPSLPVPAAATSLVPPAAATPPALAAEVRDACQIRIGDRIGATGTSPDYSDDLAGYLCNVPSSVEVVGLVTRWGTASMTASGSPYGGTSGYSEPYSVTSSVAPGDTVSGAISNPSFIAERAYPWQFRVILPEIESAARDNLSVDVAARYLVQVPADTLVLNRP